MKHYYEITKSLDDIREGDILKCIETNELVDCKKIVVEDSKIIYYFFGFVVNKKIISKFFQTKHDKLIIFIPYQKGML